MDFRNDFIAALRAGQDYHALLELVRLHRVQGLSADAAYEALQGIWLEQGFDSEVAREGTMQDVLETVMEKVWYGQPAL